jgi:competence protein ComEC
MFINVMEIVSSCLSNIRFFNIYLDFNMIEIILYYVVTIFMFYKCEFRLSIILILIIVIDIIVPYLDSNGYVYFFDVGQGDSSLVISPYRKDIILIDTGGISNYDVSDNVISFMKSIGIKSIDLLILSHGDSDHGKDVNNIFNDIDIKCLNVNLGDINELEINAMKLIDTCLYEPKNIVLKYLNYNVYDNENDNSLLTYMIIYNTSILSLGDASSIVEDNLINKYKLSNIDIFKVSHHGSKTSSSNMFINEIKPYYSVISVGSNNRYGHPNKEVLNNLNESKIYRTDQDGSIMFKIKRDNLEIKTCSP